MPISHAQERRNQARKDAKAGVVKDVSGKAKKTPENFANCALCSLPLRVTKRNVEMVQHQQAKHAGQAPFSTTVNFQKVKITQCHPKLPFYPMGQ